MLMTSEAELGRAGAPPLWQPGAREFGAEGSGRRFS